MPKNRSLIYVMFAAMFGLLIFLFVQNQRLSEKIEKLAEEKEAVSITPSGRGNNPEAVSAKSPFDRPNTDPLAVPMPPESGKMPDLTSIKFEKMIHDFGKIKEGEVVNTVFRFTNSGKNPLVITQAKGSCGCTVPRWPTHPVKVGGSDEIAVSFNSEGKKGESEKTVTVTANTDPAGTLLTVKATVIPKDK